MKFDTGLRQLLRSLEIQGLMQEKDKKLCCPLRQLPPSSEWAPGERESTLEGAMATMSPGERLLTVIFGTMDKPLKRMPCRHALEAEKRFSGQRAMLLAMGEVYVEGGILPESWLDMPEDDALFDVWVAALAEAWPDEYLAPPLPDAPMMVMDKKDRVFVHRERYERPDRRAIWHPGDLRAGQVDGLAMKAAKRKKMAGPSPLDDDGGRRASFRGPGPAGWAAWVCRGEGRSMSELVDAASPARDILPWQEAHRLRELERVITNGRRQYLKVAEALLEIHVKQLWREKFKSFEMYCQIQLSISSSHARALLHYAEVAREAASTGLPLPTQAQAGALASAAPGARVAVYQKAREEAGGQPTAALIESLIRKGGAGLARKVAAEERDVEARMAVAQERESREDVASSELLAAGAMKRAARRCHIAGWLAEEKAIEAMLEARRARAA